MKHVPITQKAKTKFTFKDNMDISMNADGSGGAFKSPAKQMSSKFVKDGVEYAKLPTTEGAYKGGTAPVAGGNMLKLGKNAVKMAKSFANAPKQYAKRQPENMLSFTKQVKSKLGKRSTQEKITGLSDKFFKGVEKSFKNNPKLEKTSSGYYGFKKPSPNKNLEKVAEQLEGAVKAHEQQAKAVRKHIKEMKSPAKQVKGDVKVKDLPKQAVEGAKKLVKKVGNIKISTEEGRKRREAKRAERKEGGTKVGNFIRKTTKKKTAEPLSPVKRKDACYSKVKSRYKKWPSAYASGALAKCRKVGAANWGNKSK